MANLVAKSSGSIGASNTIAARLERGLVSGERSRIAAHFKSVEFQSVAVSNRTAGFIEFHLRSLSWWRSANLESIQRIGLILRFFL